MDLEKSEYSGAVSLPFNENQFKDFIVSLLGKPQTLTKRFAGYFCIDKTILTDLFEIVNQRIYQQNDAKLIQFRTTIYYDDNSTTTLNGFDHLVHYNEKHPLVSIAAHLTWQFLVKFKDKDVYEKQEINLSIVTNSNSQVSLEIDEMNYNYIHESFISLKINHTARTFGADIEALFSKQIERLIQKESKIKKFLDWDYEDTPRIIFALLFGISLIGAVTITNNVNFDSVKIFSKYFFNVLYLFVGTAIFAFIASMVVKNLSIFSNPSFLLLTPESEKDKIKREKKYKSKWFWYIISLLMSLIIGVLSNYLFYKMTNL